MSQGRLHALIDGVLAIALTLLLLDLPKPTGSRALTSELLHRWPNYLAYLVVRDRRECLRGLAAARSHLLRNTDSVMPTEAPASAIELTRRAFTAANERDFDAMTSFFGPDSVWDVGPWGLGTHVGRAAIRRFLEGWIGSFDSYRVEVEDMADLGDGVVLVRAIQHAHSSGSATELRLRYAPVFVWDLQEPGTALRVTHHREIGAARAAAEQQAARQHAAERRAGRSLLRP